MTARRITKAEEKSRAMGLICEHLPEEYDDIAERLYNSSVVGGEIEKCGGVESWVRDRLSHSIVTLGEKDYVVALINSLRIAPRIAGTDYGTTRQRDLGQLWTDTARGFLGEAAISSFMKKNFNIELRGDYTVGGQIEDYLPSDVKEVVLGDGKIIRPGIELSHKTTKFNGIWLDITGAQIEHSKAFVLVKIGISRDHFVAFLKAVSFIRDKLLPKGLANGVIEEEEADLLWDSLPSFRDIPCYVSGFLDYDLINNPPEPIYREAFKRTGEFKHYLVQQYVGRISQGKPQNGPDELRERKVEFESIGQFSAAERYVANVGNLKYTLTDWRRLANKLTGDRT